MSNLSDLISTFFSNSASLNGLPIRNVCEMFENYSPRKMCNVRNIHFEPVTYMFEILFTNNCEDVQRHVSEHIIKRSIIVLQKFPSI